MLVELGLAADEARQRRREASRSSGGRGGGTSCRRIACSSACSSSPGSRPSSLVEQRAGAAVRGERVRLASGAVEREHQLPPEPLAVRMLADERLELVDELGRAAEREVRLDPLLEREQPQLLQALGLEPQRALVAESANGGPRHRSSALAQTIGRRGGPRHAPAPRALVAPALEPVRVDLAPARRRARSPRYRR